jgi:hypothetical protein
MPAAGGALASVAKSPASDWSQATFTPSSVYFFVDDSPLSLSSLLLAGGAPTVVAPDPGQGTVYPSVFSATDGTRAYWFHQDVSSARTLSGIYTAPLAGGTVAELLDMHAMGRVDAATYGGGYVYVSDQLAGLQAKVRRVSTATGTSEDIADRNYACTSLAVDSSYLYCGGDGGADRAPLGPPPVTFESFYAGDYVTCGTEQCVQSYLEPVPDSSGVYFVGKLRSPSNTVTWSLDRATAPATVSTLYTAPADWSVHAIAFDASYVYWLTEKDGDPTCSLGVVHRQLK